MGRDEAANAYFEWMVDLVTGDKFAKAIRYQRLLEHLHGIEFRYHIPKDKNRYVDGIDLRYQFALCSAYDDVDYVIDILSGPCSVLEMMLALAIRCEEDVHNPDIGDRTAQWFWKMIVNLGLGGMYDDVYDSDTVEDIIDTFLDRKYSPDGKGGLFYIPSCEDDLRKVEIWHQMCWYLDCIL